MNSDEMKTGPNDTESGDQDVENDAVIGQALRGSLIVFTFLALPVIGILIYLNIEKREADSTEVEVSLPTERTANEQPIPSLPLVNVTAEAGIDFVHQTGRYGEKLLPETMGSGVAVLDYNNDDHLDLL
ncbi:MAG: CRTAC1 family protein, partial [Planctomycetaceae bacterium]|nr:CRTAC1 family protein [Planctomycetaceae bacterium]